MSSMTEPPNGHKQYITSGELGAKLEVVDAKLTAIRWQMVAALIGGQAVAGLVAALITRTSPNDVWNGTLSVLSALT